MQRKYSQEKPKFNSKLDHHFYLFFSLTKIISPARQKHRVGSFALYTHHQDHHVSYPNNNKKN